MPEKSKINVREEEDIACISSRYSTHAYLIARHHQGQNPGTRRARDSWTTIRGDASASLSGSNYAPGCLCWLGVLTTTSWGTSWLGGTHTPPIWRFENMAPCRRRKRAGCLNSARSLTRPWASSRRKTQRPDQIEYTAASWGFALDVLGERLRRLFSTILRNGFTNFHE